MKKVLLVVLFVVVATAITRLAVEANYMRGPEGPMLMNPQSLPDWGSVHFMDTPTSDPFFLDCQEELGCFAYYPGSWAAPPNDLSITPSSGEGFVVRSTSTEYSRYWSLGPEGPRVEIDPGWLAFGITAEILLTPQAQQCFKYVEYQNEVIYHLVMIRQANSLPECYEVSPSKGGDIN